MQALAKLEAGVPGGEASQQVVEFVCGDVEAADFPEAAFTHVLAANAMVRNAFVCARCSTMLYAIGLVLDVLEIVISLVLNHLLGFCAPGTLRAGFLLASCKRRTQNGVCGGVNTLCQKPAKFLPSHHCQFPSALSAFCECAVHLLVVRRT